MKDFNQENHGKEKYFACSEEDAERKYKLYKSKDPFLEIPCALLNSADILDYIATSGMIFPFHLEPKRDFFKSASYGVKLLGKSILWDEKGEKHEKDITLKQEFPLKKNSIVFVTLEPTFRIPDYIALRFNLTIKHVHKGLLLGTGPLVDPGFKGKLLIPLHNLTENDYVLRGGEILVWIEFTKISPNIIWDTGKTENICDGPYGGIDRPRRQGEYIPFPEDKEISDPNDYLFNAFQGQPIRSSIPSILEVAEKLNLETKEKVNKISNRITWGGVIGALSIVITLIGVFVAIIYPTYNLVTDTTKYLRETTEQYSQIHIQQSEKIESLEEEIKSLKETLKEQSKTTEKRIIKPESGSENLKQEDARSDN